MVGTMLLRGYSVQSTTHVKTVASAIYTHARQEGWFSGPNPAKFVKLPEMTRATPHALSFQQVAILLPRLPGVPRLMVFLAVMMSMNVAEICGLRWKRINLTGGAHHGRRMPAPTAGVRRAMSRKGEWG